MSLLSDAEKTSLPRQDCTKREAFVKACFSSETFERGDFEREDFASYRRMALWRWQRGLASNRTKPNGLMHENILVRAGDLLR